MSLEKVIFGFFGITDVRFVRAEGVGMGDAAKAAAFTAAVVVNLIATVLKFGDRTQIGAVHLATSLVADLQLIAAALAWAFASQISSSGLDGQAMASVVSLSGGALLANLVSVTLLVIETVSFHRR